MSTLKSIADPEKLVALLPRRGDKITTTDGAVVAIVSQDVIGYSPKDWTSWARAVGPVPHPSTFSRTVKGRYTGRPLPDYHLETGWMRENLVRLGDIGKRSPTEPSA